MTDLTKLRKVIQRQGFCYSEIAKALNVTRSCISEKMKGTAEFEEIQITKLAVLLGLSEQEKEEIFFSNKVLIPKTKEKMCAISVDVVNFLAEKNCTIDEAKEILETAKWTIEHSSKVQKFKWSPNLDNKEN